MPLKNKAVIFMADEATDGQAATLSASDALLVYNPESRDTTDRNERMPASSALGRRRDSTGRSTRQYTFEMDFNGSGDTSSPFDRPPWAGPVKSCAFRERVVKVYALTSITGTFQIGEKIYIDGSESTEYGIALAVPSGSSGNLYVVWLAGSAGAGTIDGKKSSASGTAAGGATDDRYAYSPTALKSTRIQTGAWSGGPTIAVGDVVIFQRSGVEVAAGQVIEDNGSGWTDFDVELQFGDIQNGDTVVTAALQTATVGAAPEPVHNPSKTIKINRAGLRKNGLGGRGSFVLSGEAGGPLQFAFTFDGVLSDHADEALAASATLGQQIPPRLKGATCGFGLGNAIANLPLRDLSVDPQNQVTVIPDAREAGGSHHAEVTDHDVRISIKTDQVGKTAFDWIGNRELGTATRFYAKLGTANGNTLVIVAPECQVISVDDADNDGVAGFDVVLACRFLDDGVVTEEGENELFIAEISA